LNVIVSASESTGWYDPDLLEKVVSNLLSNALKFTPEGGEATVEIAVGADVEPTRVPRSTKTGAELPPADARRLILTVDNTGTYVPPSEQARIFDRFHQFGPGGGTGVGLALVRELTEWMGGTVSLSSDRETGTRFTVSLPIFVTAPSPESVATPADDRVAAANPRPAGAIDEVEMGTPEPAQEEDAAPLVLVVEDHLDLLGYLQKELSPAFRVTGAVDGLAGLDAAVSTIPDLVLSDVMMPKMNGFELCRRLKKDERTSHIPVILLTARTETESRRHGLETGADDYLAKPFSLEELRIRIRNLIEQRRKLAEQFARQVAMLSPEAMPVTSADERFVLRAREVVEGHLDDPDFRIETLCREVGMSRAQLHRKLKAVTGRSAWEFVRIHRLQRAAQLLEAGYGNVTEVALAVGFRHLSHFAKSFREQYGSPPSDYPPRA
jgi:DNA-binding response OmpR family regulator